MIKTAAFLALLASLLLSAAPARSAALLVEETRLPARFGATGPVVELEAVIVRPGDEAKRPLCLISHGSPRDPDERSGMTAMSRLREAEEFARRGFVTVVFMRRGFGSSGGSYAEGYGGVDNPAYAAAGRKGAEDIREVIRIMKGKPYVDGSKILCVGRSAGGLATLALTADAPEGLVCAINFAGGRGSTEPDTVAREDLLLAAFGNYGKTSRVPVLFVYAENDHYFSPRLAKAFFAAFTGAGGRGELVMAPAFGEDGHNLFSRKGIPLWTPVVDAFLAKCGFALVTSPPVLDRPSPPPPPGLSERGRKHFADYLDAPPHKAFAVAPGGRFGWASGKRSPGEAEEKALDNCYGDTDEDCAVVNADGRPR